jgi:glycosyltransferase involved in cell wall biosynthesis
MSLKIAMYMPGLRARSMGASVYGDFAAAVRDAGADFILLTDSGAEGNDDSGADVVALPREPLAQRMDQLLQPLTRARSLVSTAVALHRWLRANPDTDVLYTEITYPLGAAAWIAARTSGWRGQRIVAPLGEDFLLLEEASYGHRRHFVPRWLISHTMRAADAVRCISPMVESYAAPFARPLRVFPLNVVNALLDQPTPSVGARQQARRELHRQLGIETPHLVLSLGRLHPFKGIHFLVDAMDRLADAHLVIAGPSMRVANFGDYRTYLEARACDRGVDDRVHFVDALPPAQVGSMMAAADVVVVPSVLESMNRVCAEAAAAGTPFVVTSSTGVADLIAEPGVGQVVPPRDAAAIAAAVRAVLDGTWQRDDAAAGRFLEQFRASHAAAELLALIAQVARP